MEHPCGSFVSPLACLAHARTSRPFRPSSSGRTSRFCICVSFTIPTPEQLASMTSTKDLRDYAEVASLLRNRWENVTIRVFGLVTMELLPYLRFHQQSVQKQNRFFAGSHTQSNYTGCFGWLVRARLGSIFACKQWA